MARTYLHQPYTNSVVDQEWTNDVTNVVVRYIGWNGTYIQPKVSGIVFDKTAGHGIQVDNVTPTYPWVDLLGHITVDEAAASNKPTFTTYNGSIKQYRFAVNDQIYINYHIPHDYLPGSDMFVHTHWSSIDNSLGDVTWALDVSYASGHQVGTFTSPKTVLCSGSFISPLKHMVNESPLSSVGGSASTLDTNLIEVDGVILIRAKLQSNSMSSSPFLHFIDIHYQSTGIGTKNKTPNFYG